MNYQIQQAILSVKDVFSAEFVYVFGSYARGNQHPGSDLDILVVCSQIADDPFELTYRIRRHLHERLDLALDVIVTSKDQFEQRLHQPWTIEYIAHTEGVAV